MHIIFNEYCEGQEYRVFEPEEQVYLLGDMGDLVLVWNDSYYFFDDKTSYHHPAQSEWAGTTWDWGDDTPLTFGGPMVNHVYQNPGTYTITMKFTDTEGAQGTATQEIKVLAMPIR